MEKPHDFALPEALSPGHVLTTSDHGHFPLDQETIDNFVNNYDLDPALDAQLFSYYVNSIRSRQASHSGTVASPGIAPGISSHAERESRPQDLDYNPSRDVSGTTIMNAANGSTNTEKGKGWLSTMHIAAQKGHDRLLHVFLEQGNMDPNSSDSDGRTPLFYAAIGGHTSAVRLLLSNGSRVSHLDNDRRTVLHWVSQYQRLEVLRVLLEHWSQNERDSCDINAYDDHGWNPLHLAVERGFEEGVLLLIQWGADMNKKARKCWLTKETVPFDLTQLPD
ncbi:ankyrin repeat-containing domain protein [Aspergillus venezuelensis]